MKTHLDTETCKMYNLSDIDDLREIHFTDEEDWLEKRKSTIGGSEIGIVLGLNDYSSKLQLYKNKKTERKNPDNVYTRKGKELENLIFTNYVKPYFDELGYDVYKPDKILVRESTPWLSANLDGIAIPRTDSKCSEDNIVVEIKWVSQWGAQKWDTSEEYGNIPASYYAQVQDYMYHIDAKQAVVFAMFDDTWTCEPYVIKRNERFINKMIAESEAFYKMHLLMDIPPKADIRFDSADIAAMISDKSAITPVKTSEEYDLLLAKYKSLKSSEKDLEAEVKETLNQILEKHLEGYVPDKVNIKFICSKRTTTTIDAKKLRELYPEIAEQCTKTTEYTWTSVR